MTIAAGFHFADGLLLCADTQITSPGYMKLNDSKIVAIDFESNGGSKAAFALTGHLPYCHMAVEHCRRELASKTPAEMTSSGIMLAIENALEMFCQDHLWKHPSFERRELSVEMLIATWSHLDRELTLLAARENAVNIIRDYDCLGAGQFLAHYLIPTLFRHSSMGLLDATNIAHHVLKETKSFVDSCGGGSQLIVLRKDGSFANISHSTIKTGETMSTAFKESIKRLLVCSADLSMDDEKLKDEFYMAFQIVNASRKMLRNEENREANEVFYQVMDENFKRLIIRS